MYPRPPWPLDLSRTNGPCYCFMGMQSWPGKPALPLFHHYALGTSFIVPCGESLPKIANNVLKNFEAYAPAAAPAAMPVTAGAELAPAVIAG